MNKKATNTELPDEQAVTEDNLQATPSLNTPEQQLYEIRDLLFGEQQRTLQHGIERLERNTQQKLQEMSDLFSSALNNLKEESTAKIEELAQHVEELHKKHESEEHLLASDLGDLQQDLSETRNELQQADNDINTHLNEEANRLMNELTAKYNEMMANLKATSEELKTNKADRKTLATLLASVANNLNEDE